MSARATNSRSSSRKAPKSAPTELRNEIQELKRRRILEESRNLFFSQGYETTTLDTIASSLQVTKPFIYSYFRNKSEILNALCEIGIRGPLAVLEEVLATKLAPHEKLRQAMERLTQTVIENQQCIVIYRREEKNLEAREAKALAELKERFDQKLAALLEAGRRSTQFSMEDTHFTAVCIGGLLTWLALWYRPAGRWSQSELTAHMTRTVDRMVGWNPR